MKNRGASQSSPVHQVFGGSPLWGDWSNMKPAAAHKQTSSQTTTSSSSSSPVFPNYAQHSSLQTAPTLHDNQELPESWSQLLLGGFVEEEERCSYYSTPLEAKMEHHDHHVLYPSSSAHMVDAKSSWSQILPSSSPRSCVTTCTPNSSILDFSNNKAERKHLQVLDHSSECNSIQACSQYKKARVQAASAQSTFKVRKEKLGDRISALHQLVSPFGKTDTASVLLEAIGYIRFLQSQIQALSSPYLGTGPGNINHSVQGERSCIFPEDPGQLLNDNCMKSRGPVNQDGVNEPKKDLRSRGLCLVPVSFIMHVSNDNEADYWAPSFAGGFR